MMLIKLLKDNPNVDNFSVKTDKKESVEMFFALGKLETVRKTNVENSMVTVYTKNGEFMGEASFSVFPSDSKSALQNKIESALNSAHLVNNKPYELPKEEHLVKSIKSNMKDIDFVEMGKKIYGIADKVIKETGAQINALEIFMDKKSTEIENGNGLKKKMNYYNLFIEAIPTYDKGEDSYELYQAINLSVFDEAKIEDELRKYLEQVKNRAYAVRPTEKIDAPVILNKEELSELFNNLADMLHYQTKYNHGNIFDVGDDIQKGNGDKINLEVKSYIPGSSHNKVFDNDGASFKDKVLIKDGIVEAFYGGTKYASYLGKEITGNLPCVEVQAGSADFDKICQKPYFECLSFSGIQIEEYSDYLGGEVRLAKYFDGKEVKYITGVSISGSLSEILRSMKLSKKKALYGNYLGPDKALMKMEIM